jgi:hypothetical protein
MMKLLAQFLSIQQLPTDSNHIAAGGRRKRQRFPPNLLIVRPAVFPIKASGNPNERVSEASAVPKCQHWAFDSECR